MKNKDQINVLIVEDEAMIASMIQGFLFELGIKKVEWVNSINMFKQEYSSNIDLVILDINLGKGEEGFAMAKIIGESHQTPYFFLTSYQDQETIAKASSFGPIDYIIKPFSRIDIFKAIELHLKNYRPNGANKDFMLIRDKGMDVKVIFNEITLIKSDNVYLEVHLENGEILLHRNTLAGIMELLPNNFLHVHRSYVVNVNKVSSFTTTQLFLGEVDVPISKSYREIVKSSLE